MQSKFVRNLALVLSLNLLIKPFWILGVDRQVQNAVGVENYGLYYAIFMFSFLMNILLDLGITNFNNKNIAQNNHLLSKHFASIALLKFILAIVFIVVTLSIGLIVGYNFIQMKLLMMVVYSQIMLSFIMYLRSNLAGLHLFKTDSIISVLDRLIMIVICEFLLITHTEPGSFNVLWFIYAQMVGYTLTAIITLVIVLDKAKVRRLKWRWPFFMMILKKSYPFAVLVLLMTFYTSISGPMLERMLPAHEGSRQAGIYASANRLLDASNMIAFLFAGLLLPMFARMIKLKESVEQLVGLSFSLLVIPAIVVAVCSYFYSDDIMNLLYHGQHVEESSEVFRVLMCCFVAISSTYIFGTLLTANGNLKQLNFMASGGMILNLVMNIFLIPKMGARGAAFSSFVTQFLMAGAQILMVQYVFKFRIHYRFIIAMTVFFAAIIGLNIFIQPLQFNWIIKIAVTAGLSFAIAIGLKLIQVKNIYKTFRYGDS